MKLTINPIMIGLSMPKKQPAVQTLFLVAPTEQTGTNYIDLSQCASIVNRRLYRQGLNWVVSGMKLITEGVTGSVIISKINETWITNNAWNKSFKLWHEMNKQVLESNPGMKPKFYDFKVGMDATHDFATNLLPWGMTAQATAG